MITNPVKAIGAWCLDCCGGSQIARKECGAPDCVLYPFRFGKNPYRTPRDVHTPPTEAQLAALEKGRQQRLEHNMQKKNDLKARDIGARNE